MPNRQPASDHVLLRFRKSGGIMVLSAAFLVAPALLILPLVVNGAIHHDRSTVFIGSGFVAAFGIFAAVALFWVLRPGALTATTLTLPLGMKAMSINGAGFTAPSLTISSATNLMVNTRERTHP